MLKSSSFTYANSASAGFAAAPKSTKKVVRRAKNRTTWIAAYLSVLFCEVSAILVNLGLVRTLGITSES